MSVSGGVEDTLISRDKISYDRVFTNPDDALTFVEEFSPNMQGFSDRSGGNFLANTDIFSNISIYLSN